MKTFSDEALAALQRGDALVAAAVEIIPTSTSYSIQVVGFNAEYDYQIIGSVVDADPVGDIVVPTTGFDDTGIAPFGDPGTGAIPTPPDETSWLPQTSLWLKRDITIIEDGTLNFSGVLENGAVFFIDDVPVGSVNADGADLGGGFYSVDAGSVTAGSHTLKILCLDEAEDKGAADVTYFYTNAVLTVAGGDPADPIRIWSGYGAKDLPSDAGTSTYLGIGDRGMVQQLSAAIGGSAQNLTLTLSGIEPAALALLEPDEVKGASAVVRLLIFDSSGTVLLGGYVFTRGRVDELKTSEVVGGAASIQLAIEGAARGLGRRGGRLRSDADQRLVSSSDGFYRVVSAAPLKTLYWGGKKPSTAGGVLGGGSASAGGPGSGALRQVN